MKRAIYPMVVIVAAGLLWMGCSSPQQKAQKLYDAGQYEQVVAKYSDEPTAAPIVQQSKDKIAEKWLAEGRYQAVVDTFPNSPSAKEARNKLADQLLQQKRYQEVIDKYPETPAAMTARAEMARDTTKSDRTGVEQPRGSTGPGTNPPGTNARETGAEAEYNRIMAIKMKDLRTKALRDFVADARYTGTAAHRKAQQQLNP